MNRSGFRGHRPDGNQAGVQEFRSGSHGRLPAEREPGLGTSWRPRLHDPVRVEILDTKKPPPHRAGAGRLLAGAGDPNGRVAGDVGDLYQRLDGGPGATLYVKESGTQTAAGWTAK